MSAADAMQSGNADLPPAHPPICDGDTVVLDVNGEKQAFVTVKRTGYVRLVVRFHSHNLKLSDAHVSLLAMCSKVKVGKQLCSLEPCIGQPFGSMFQLSLDSSELVRVKRCAKTAQDNLHVISSPYSLLSF